VLFNYSDFKGRMTSEPIDFELQHGAIREPRPRNVAGFEAGPAVQHAEPTLLVLLDGDPVTPVRIRTTMRTGGTDSAAGL